MENTSAEVKLTSSPESVTTTTTHGSWLDRPVLGGFSFSLETILYVVLAVIGVATRFWDLGARVISHDESLHALYSWKLYAGQGYQHNPMMHGPFLFHANAFIYFLFGANDYTARIMPAIFGVALILLPYLLRKWLGRTGALLAAVFFAISPSFLYYSRYIRDDIYIAVFFILMVISLFRYLDERKNKWLYIGSAAMILGILSMEASYIMNFIGLSFIVFVVVWERLGEWQRLVLRAVGVGVAVILTAFVAFLLLSGAPPADNQLLQTAHKFLQYAVVLICLDVGLLFVSMVYRPNGTLMLDAIRSVSFRAIVICAIIVLIVFALLSTTFFTNPFGLWTASGGAIQYWIDQHGVQRGGQPWFYYIFLLIPLYEFLPLVFSVIGTLYFLIKGVPNLRGADDRGSGQTRMFVAFLIYWAVASLTIFSWAGEKMPWLVIHPVEPMILLSGAFMGRVIDAADWRAIWKRGGLYLGLTFCLLGLSLITLLRITPFAGFSIWNLQDTGQWLTAAIATVVLIALAVTFLRRLGARSGVQILLVSGMAVLSLLTWRFAWMASYINYDYASEFLVYAHGAPDVKLALSEIEDISRRTVGDTQIKVAYDDDSTWPLEWYFREFPNRVYYGAQPSRESLDAPIVIVGDKNLDKVKPFLGNRYNQYKYRLVWWPIEDYKSMSLQGVWDTLSDPARREALWNIVFYRKYDTPFNNWPFVHRFYMYVRKDVESQLWGRAGAGTAPLEEQPVDPYAKGQKQVPAVLTWGQQGSGPGQFNDPRDVAVDAEGNVYVADSNNHRIQKFDSEGKVLMEWGKQGADVAQFQEPWGVAVDEQGNVYVADTWNHRVEKFDAQGKFLLEFGAFADTKGEPNGQPGTFWGPRSIAIDSKGNVFVTDTGNKRVEVFASDGTFLRQFGQAGLAEGQFQEPVGIAIDAGDNVYVADTWNRRVQKFDANLDFVKEWPIVGWDSQSVVNKPYLAVDDKNHVFVTDPEGYRVIEFDTDGNFIATFGQFGTDASSFNLPTGIAVDKQGNVYVADAGNQRIMKFAPLQ